MRVFVREWGKQDRNATIGDLVQIEGQRVSIRSLSKDGDITGFMVSRQSETKTVRMFLSGLYLRFENVLTGTKISPVIVEDEGETKIIGFLGLFDE